MPSGRYLIRMSDVGKTMENGGKKKESLCDLYGRFLRRITRGPFSNRSTRSVDRQRLQEILDSKQDLPGIVTLLVHICMRRDVLVFKWAHDAVAFHFQKSRTKDYYAIIVLHKRIDGLVVIF